MQPGLGRCSGPLKVRVRFQLGEGTLPAKKVFFTDLEKVNTTKKILAHYFFVTMKIPFFTGSQNNASGLKEKPQKIFVYQ